MSGETLRCKVVVTNPFGLHMRPLSLFAQRASQFQSVVQVIKGDQRFDGKRLLDLMLLAAEQGTELTLEVSGCDAPVALPTLAEILTAPGVEEPPAEPLPPKG